LEGGGDEGLSRHATLSGPSLLDGIPTSRTILAVGSMGLAAVAAPSVDADPVDALEFRERLPSILAPLAVLSVRIKTMFGAATKDALDGAGVVGLGVELPATIALEEVDFLLPALGVDHRAKHDRGGVVKGSGDRLVRVLDGESQVAVHLVGSKVPDSPTRVETEDGSLQNWMRALDVFEEFIWGPCVPFCYVDTRIVPLAFIEVKSATGYTREYDLGPGENLGELRDPAGCHRLLDGLGGITDVLLGRGVRKGNDQVVVGRPLSYLSLDVVGARSALRIDAGGDIMRVHDGLFGLIRFLADELVVRDGRGRHPNEAENPSVCRESGLALGGRTGSTAGRLKRGRGSGTSKGFGLRRRVLSLPAFPVLDGVEGKCRGPSMTRPIKILVIHFL